MFACEASQTISLGAQNQGQRAVAVKGMQGGVAIAIKAVTPDPMFS
jgi:hypothetical protein